MPTSRIVNNESCGTGLGCTMWYFCLVKIFSEPQFDIFPAELHLGDGDTQTLTKQVPEEI